MLQCVIHVPSLKELHGRNDNKGTRENLREATKPKAPSHELVLRITIHQKLAGAKETSGDQDQLDKAEAELDGVIFLLEPKQTPDDELLKQKDFRTVPQPQNPPHQNIRFQYALRAASDLMLTVKPRRWRTAAVPMV